MSQVPAVITEFRGQIGKMESQFALVLPRHISPQRFRRVVETAVMREPRLLACDRQSLINEAMKAANDGLLPDGREGVLVPFGGEDDEHQVGKVRPGSKVTWIPMIQGLRKKVRNAGVLRDWNVQVVQDGDEFDYQLGDDPYIKHKPALRGGRDREVIAAYSIATYPDGTKSFEVMNRDQINDIRKKSRAKKGPWADPIFFPEMARKTVARLHSKQLPMSTDLELTMRRDDPLYDFENRAPPPPAMPRPSSVNAALDYFGAGGGEPPPDASTRPERKEGTADSGASAESDRTSPEASASGGEPAAGPPKTPEQYRAFACKVIDGAKTLEDAMTLEDWFAGSSQIKMRNTCGLVAAQTNELKELIAAKIAAFQK